MPIFEVLGRHDASASSGVYEVIEGRSSRQYFQFEILVNVVMVACLVRSPRGGGRRWGCWWWRVGPCDGYRSLAVFRKGNRDNLGSLVYTNTARTAVVQEQLVEFGADLLDQFSMLTKTITKED